MALKKQLGRLRDFVVNRFAPPSPPVKKKKTPPVHIPVPEGSILVWHGTATGNDDRTINSIRHNGLSTLYNRAARNMQEPGVHFSLSKEWARSHAKRLPKYSDDSQRYGLPVVVAALYDPLSKDWDLDYEFSHRAALRFLKKFEDRLEDFPAGKADIVVTKANMPLDYPDAGTREREEVIVDWTLTHIRMGAHGPTLVLDDNAFEGTQHEIGIDWHTGEVTGAHPHISSFTSLLEQVVHHYRNEDPEAFRKFLADEVHAAAQKPDYTENRAGITLKHTGYKPLPAVAFEIRKGPKWWEPAK